MNRKFVKFALFISKFGHYFHNILQDSGSYDLSCGTSLDGGTKFG